MVEGAGNTDEKEFQTCIRPEPPRSHLSKEESVPSELGKPEEEKKEFEKLTASLVQRGAVVEVIPSESGENASYTPSTDMMRVHKDDFFDLYQEAIHRLQTKTLKRNGFQTEPYLERPLSFSAEIGAISIILRLSEKELTKARNRIYQNIDTVEDDLKIIRLSEQIGEDYQRLLEYQAKLYSVLKSLSTEQLEKYDRLFNNPLFSGAENVIRWVRLGINPPRTISLFDPLNPDDTTCFWPKRQINS